MFLPGLKSVPNTRRRPNPPAHSPIHVDRRSEQKPEFPPASVSAISAGKRHTLEGKPIARKEKTSHKQRQKGGKTLTPAPDTEEPYRYSLLRTCLLKEKKKKEEIPIPCFAETFAPHLHDGRPEPRPQKRLKKCREQFPTYIRPQNHDPFLILRLGEEKEAR